MYKGKLGELGTWVTAQKRLSGLEAQNSRVDRCQVAECRNATTAPGSRETMGCSSSTTSASCPLSGLGLAGFLRLAGRYYGAVFGDLQVGSTAELKCARLILLWLEVWLDGYS